MPEPTRARSFASAISPTWFIVAGILLAAGILGVLQMFKDPPTHELLAICNEAHATYDSYCRAVEETETFSRQRSEVQRINDDPAELARFAWQQALQQVATGVDRNQSRKQELQGELNASRADTEALARLQRLREPLALSQGRTKAYQRAHNHVQLVLDSYERFIRQNSQPENAAGMLEYYYDYCLNKTFNVVGYITAVELISGLSVSGDQDLWRQELETSWRLTEQGRAWLESEQHDGD